MKSSLKDKTCCFTGHRKLTKKYTVRIEACLEKVTCVYLIFRFFEHIPKDFLQIRRIL